MTDVFTYTKEEFEREIMPFFEDYTAVQLKELTYDIMGRCSESFKKLVNKRIISRNLGKDWWPNYGDTKGTKEILAIWKMYVYVIKNLIYNTITVVDYAHERLEELEEDLSRGIWNEQQYIEKANWIKKCRDNDDKLCNCCSCSVIGSMNPMEDGDIDIVFSVVCLPCGFDKNSTPLTFG